MPIKVFYEGEVVGKFKADRVVHEVMILELKSVQTIIKDFEVPLVNYLTATGKPVGLLLNFGPKKGEVKRKVRVLPGEESSCKFGLSCYPVKKKLMTL